MKIQFLAPVITALMLAAAASYVSQYSNAQDAPRRVEIVAKRFDYSPGEITLKKGVPVVFVVTSKDVEHGLKFKDLNITIDVKKGQTTEVTFTPTQTGTFTGQCSVFCGSGHGSMKMVMHVTE
jgi:cytochrome c oxidase subunit II